MRCLSVRLWSRAISTQASSHARPFDPRAVLWDSLSHGLAMYAIDSDVCSAYSLNTSKTSLHERWVTRVLCLFTNYHCAQWAVCCFVPCIRDCTPLNIKLLIFDASIRRCFMLFLRPTCRLNSSSYTTFRFFCQFVAASITDTSLSTPLKFIENGSRMAKRIQNTVHKNKSNDKCEWNLKKTIKQTIKTVQ